MPGFLLAPISGGNQILSGNFFSGQGIRPLAQIRLTAHPANSGYVYFAFSGNMTINSGGVNSSGYASGGLMDGTPLAPGGSVDLPKYMFPSGGTGSGINIYVNPDANCSGQARLFVNPY